MTWTTQSAPSLDDFARLAREAFDALPEPFRSLAGEVVIRIDDFADEETLAMMEMEDPFELTGLLLTVAVIGAVLLLLSWPLKYLMHGVK